MPAPSCRICSGSTVLAFRGRDGGGSFAPTCHEPGAHGDLYRCVECATVQQPSLPGGEALHELYRVMEDDGYLAEEEGRRRTARRLLDMLAPHVPSGKLLELGCGHGLLLDEARARGYDGLGLELARDAAVYARETLGLNVLEIPVEHPELDGERYDAILLIDVIEHLDDPVGVIDRCVELLAPGGALMIVTPDPSSRTARLAGSRWWGYLPAHYCLIPRATLRELVCARGLVMAEDTGLVRSFTPAYWFAGLAERGGALGGAFERVSASLPRGAHLSLSLGDEMVVLARKVDVLEPETRLVRDRGGSPKVHAVLPSYKAARTIHQVAHEMPEGVVDRALVVDDASPDRTVAAALEAGFEVLAHPTNRGYGANQKTCYVRAARDGADVVVMVHGDNQYDPSLVAAMVRPILDGEADVVMGSRLLQDESIAGGMPRWKWIGNRFLTWTENRVFDRDWSEYHTGYRAFSVDFLRTIPFLRNSDDFVFDQEIYAQIVARNARVVELAIPTRYFLEASRVSFPDSVVYGLKTLRVLGRFWVDQRRGRWPLLRKPALDIVPARTDAPVAAPDETEAR